MADGFCGFCCRTLDAADAAKRAELPPGPSFHGACLLTEFRAFDAREAEKIREWRDVYRARGREDLAEEAERLAVEIENRTGR